MRSGGLRSTLTTLQTSQRNLFFWGPVINFWRNYEGLKMIDIILTFILSLILWFRTFVFYAPNQSMVGKDYSVAVFCHGKKRKYCMIDIQPEDVQFFVDDGLLIYQPSGRASSLCPRPTHPDLAFIIQPHTPVCRRSLSFLKRYIYTEVVYKRVFPELKNPIAILKRLIYEEGVIPVSNLSSFVGVEGGV